MCKGNNSSINKSFTFYLKQKHILFFYFYSFTLRNFLISISAVGIRGGSRWGQSWGTGSGWRRRGRDRWNVWFPCPNSTLLLFLIIPIIQRRKIEWLHTNNLLKILEDFLEMTRFFLLLIYFCVISGFKMQRCFWEIRAKVVLSKISTCWDRWTSCTWSELLCYS